jgi:hypothetical protein
LVIKSTIFFWDTFALFLFDIKENILNSNAILPAFGNLSRFSYPAASIIFQQQTFSQTFAGNFTTYCTASIMKTSNAYGIFNQEYHYNQL